MKKILFCLLALGCISNLMAENLQPKRTVIIGRVRNIQPSDNQVITVNYTDPITNSKKASRIAPDGTFHTDNEMIFTQNITVNYAGRFINIMVSPSDSVFVDIDMDIYRKSNQCDGVTFSGNNNIKFNQQLPNLIYYLSDIVPDFKEGLSAEEFITEFTKVVNDTHNKIDNYAKEHNTLPELVEWVKRDVIYTYANYIITYYNSKTENESRLKVFTDKIFDINNAENFKTMMFSYHLGSVLSAIISSNKTIIDYVKKADLKNATQEAIKTFMQLPASVCRDYMIYEFTKSVFEHAKELDKLDNELIKMIFNDYFTDRYFVKMLEATFKPTVSKNYQTLNLKGISYLKTDKQAEALPNGDFIEYLAKKYPNKVIYIDVYATWCGPCMAEMKPSKDLKKLFVDKDVVFVYACLGSDQNKWQPTIDKQEIVGEHYFFDTDASSLFMSGYNLSGYPSYILVDKNGKIVTTDAPRPSNISKTADTIDKLL